MPKILPLKMKFSTKGKKAREAPKEAPKRAKKKETKGWANLTSEIDHENQKTEEKRWILKTQKTKTNTNKKRKKNKKLSIIYIYAIKKEGGGGEERHILKGSTESTATECTGLKKIAEKGWKRKSLE